jgi:hypothetical protein
MIPVKQGNFVVKYFHNVIADNNAIFTFDTDDKKMFFDEITASYAKEGENMVKSLFENLLGKHEFYRRIVDDVHYGYKLRLPISETPTRLIAVDSNIYAPDITDLVFDKGWTFRFKPCNKRKESSCCEIQLLGMPVDIYSYVDKFVFAENRLEVDHVR